MRDEKKTTVGRRDFLRKVGALLVFAASTLAGGTCVRTESATCLMEWGGGSSVPVGQGNGLSQRETARWAHRSPTFVRKIWTTLDEDHQDEPWSSRRS